MQVFITGATGLIGAPLTVRLRERGHDVAAWVRSAGRARAVLGPDVELIPAGDDRALQGAVERTDAIVNLAGEPVAGGRWTKRRKRALVESRVTLTGRLVDAIERASSRPSVLLSGSAVGLYGDRGDEPLGEDSAPGNDFLARLCFDWEAAARRAEPLGVRVVLLRTGVVLAPSGGALAKMLPIFRAGLGGPVGSGRQRMPWIHLHDEVELALTALEDERYHGPLNATAPAPVTNAELTRAIGRALGRPTVLRVPPLVVRAVFGEAADVLVGGQRAEPRRALALGFRHRFTDLDAALDDLLGASPQARPGSVPPPSHDTELHPPP